LLVFKLRRDLLRRFVGGEIFYGQDAKPPVLLDRQ
jgi:hypothetical protein